LLPPSPFSSDTSAHRGGAGERPGRRPPARLAVGHSWPDSRSKAVFHSLFRSSTPGMYLMVLQAARARPRMAYIRVSLISSSVAPACRELARTLGVNRATVVLAYEELVAAGWARSHVGQGTFVLESVRPRVAVAAAPAVAPRNGDGHGPTRAPLNWSAFFSRSARI